MISLEALAADVEAMKHKIVDADDLMAELAALNMAVLKALQGMASVAGREGVREQYLKTVLEAGLRDLENTNYWSVPAERRAAFIEKARARYTDIIMGVGPN